MADPAPMPRAVLLDLLPDAVPVRMAGTCRSGFERDAGVRRHAVREAAFLGWGAAICGARPGDRGNGWATRTADAVTCPRCLARLARMQAKAAKA